MPCLEGRLPATPLDATDVALPKFQPGDRSDGEAFAFSSHARAREAIEFGLSIREFGFNIFVLGDTNSGRMTATLDFLTTFVADMPPANDIVYLNNFVRPHRPKPYGLPAGMARKFRDHMTALVPKLREAFVQAFGGKDYEREITTRRESMQKELTGQLEELKTEARADGLDVVQTEHGMMVVAIGPDGEPVALDTFAPQEREKLEASAKQLNERVFEFNRSATKLNVEFMSEAADLNRQVADSAVGHLIDELETEFSSYGGLRRWIVELRADILEQLHLFRPHPEGEGSHASESVEARYAVNLFVDNGDEESPSVVLEPNPTYENLFGRIEYRPVAGLLETDFSMMRAGALHRANGGILVLRAESLARDPASWELLKGALRDRKFRFEELQRAGSLPIAGAPTPKPVPLDLNIVIIGSPQAYYAFFSIDPEFRTYFEVKADIDSDMDATQENIDQYSGLIRAMARKQGDECDDEAIVRLLGESSRSGANRTKLTARYELWPTY